MVITCPSCEGERERSLGRIPQMDIFAGNRLIEPPPVGNLYTCETCNLWFKWPTYSKAAFAQLYDEGADTQWNYTKSRREDWGIAVNYLKSYTNEGAILDVGCWSGNFLKQISSKWEKFGIEINQAACQKARGLGINILARDIDGVKAKNKMDVVTAFDVIEHIETPYKFMHSLLNLTKEGGAIIISTGNTEIFPWRVARSKFLYCANPEHVSFFNLRWFRYIAERLNFAIENFSTHCHSQTPGILKVFSGSVKNLVYLATPSVFTLGREVKHRLRGSYDKERSYNYPPLWNWYADHFIVILKKKN